MRLSRTRFSGLQVATWGIVLQVPVLWLYILSLDVQRSTYTNTESSPDATAYGGFPSWEQWLKTRKENWTWNTIDPPVLTAPTTLEHTYDLSGILLNDKGQSGIVDGKVSASLLHSFSPMIEEEARKRFLDPPGRNNYLALSPTVTWFNGELVLVVRLYLYPDHRTYVAKNNWPSNRFLDNYLFTQRFDSNLEPTNNGMVMGIPTPKQAEVGDGPIDPRLFVLGQKLFFTFNACFRQSKKPTDGYVDFPVLWDFDENKPSVLVIKDGRPKQKSKDSRYEKNWVALNIKDELHFVHMLDPLRILKCNPVGSCGFVHRETKNVVTGRQSLHLRGGTPFELYQWPYYLSVTHTTFFKKKKKDERFYLAHLTLLCVEPFRLVYVSDRLRFDPDLFKGKPSPVPWVKDNFFFPVGLIIADKNTIYISGHVNDRASVLIKLDGLQTILMPVIRADRRHRNQTGPPVNSVQKSVFNRVDMEFPGVFLG